MIKPIFWYAYFITALIILFLLFGCSTPTKRTIVNDGTQSIEEKIKIIRDENIRKIITFARNHREYEMDYDLHFRNHKEVIFLTLFSNVDVKIFSLPDSEGLSLVLLILDWEINNYEYHYTWQNSVRSYFGLMHYTTNKNSLKE